MNRKYRVSKDMYPEVAVTSLTMLAELAAGHTYPVADPAIREWAQRVLDRMIADRYIELEDEVQP